MSVSIDARALVAVILLIVGVLSVLPMLIAGLRRATTATIAATRKAIAWARPRIPDASGAPLIGLACAGVGLWVLFAPSPQPVGPTFDDTLQQVYAADRALKVELLREAAGKTWDAESDDQYRLMARDWFNEQHEARRQEIWQPFIDELAVALNERRFAEFADALEGKR